jgi:hypothetical protein
VTIHIPVQAPAREVEDSVHGDAWSRGGGEQRGTARLFGSVCAENQVPVARQNAHMVGVLVERMLPPALANDAQENLLARMHVGLPL